MAAVDDAPADEGRLIGSVTDVPPTLLTPRLVLRPLVESDFDFLAVLLGDPRVMRHYPAPLSREEARGWLERQWARYAADGHGFWLVADRGDGAPLGQVGLLIQRIAVWDDMAVPEIGYLLHADHWGRGYATEAACAVRDWAFDVRGYPRVVSLIRPGNAASQDVARRLGLRVVAETLRAGLAHDVWALDAPPRPSED